MAASAIYAGMQAAGLGLSVLGGLRSSRAKRRRADIVQGLAEINAQRRAASGQQEAFEEERQAQLAASRALAVAAASGRSASKGSAADIQADISGEGAYRAALRVYEAEEDARMMRLTGKLEASALRDEAKASRIGAGIDLISGGASLYEKYGGGGPNKNSGFYGSGYG